MVWSVKSPLVIQASHVRVMAEVLTALLLIQTLANVPGKATEDSPSPWALAIHVGHWDGVPSSWIQVATAPAPSFISIRT